MTSATAPVILACRFSILAGKGGKYTLSLTDPHNIKFSGLKLGD
jgi:hypothetical protein